MLRRVRDRAASERAFTLVELLAAILIIGILTAIALPQFFVHRDKAEDADAKTAARSLSIEVESCYVVEENFLHCDEPTELPQSGLDIGTNPGQAYVSNSTVTSYVVTAVSKGNMGGNHLFHLGRPSVGSPAARSCTPPGKGGCPVSGDW